MSGREANRERERVRATVSDEILKCGSLNDENLNSMVARYANETDCSVNLLNNLFYIESV